MADRQSRIFDTSDVLWQIENEEFVPDSDSDNDNFDRSDEEVESGSESGSDTNEESEEATSSTSSPPVRRRRTYPRRRGRPVTPRGRVGRRPATGGSRPTYNWRKTFTGRTLRPFGGQRSVSSRQLNSSSSPLDCFKQFFNENVIGLIVQMTNLNATRKLHEESVRNNAKEKAWKAIDAEEIYAFLGLVIVMGIIRLPTLDMYWQTKNWILDVPSINKIMPRKRFRDILRYLHFCDESLAPKADDPNKDKLYKIRGLLLLILPLFQSCYNPGREISIDETLIPFKGRIGFRQFIKSKRARFGIKVWVLAESATGYVSRLQFYTGKDPTASPDIGLSSRVVRYLIEPYEGLNHHLYVDNFYTSPELFEYLHSKGVYACGTFRSNRIGFPKEIIIKRATALTRGTTDWVVAGELLAQSWVDNRAVYFLSTIHKPEYDDGHVGKKTVKRKGGRGGDSGSLEVPCPPLLIDYNTHMGGVDLSDQMRKYYNLTRKSKVWYRRVFSYLVELAIHNARVVIENVTETRWNGIDFREKLFTELIGSHRASRRTSQNPSTLPRLSNVGRHFPIPTQIRLVCPVCAKKSQIAPATSKTTTSRSRVKCSDCNVHLCVSEEKTCFRDWHTKVEYWR